jgi:hypothetical protein
MVRAKQNQASGLKPDWPALAAGELLGPSSLLTFQTSQRLAQYECSAGKIIRREKHMKKRLTFTLLVLLMCGKIVFGEAAQRQSPPTISQVEGGLVDDVESAIVPAADAMPEEKYSFVPSNGQFKDVRNFAQQLKHLATSNYEMGSAILGEKPPVDVGGENGPDSVEGKAEIIQYVKNSFAYLRKALTTINEKNATEEIQSPIEPGTVTKLGLGTLCLWHDFDHYGQMVEYLRMNGIVPPASRY